MTITSPPEYVLGSDAAELERLDLQARTIAAPTGLLLRAAGIAPGMRVLDIGTGLGHVSQQLAELVGPEGSVVGLDRDPAMLEAAGRRRDAAGLHTIRYVQGDVRTFTSEEPFDAVVGRLVLFHLPDAVDVIRHHLDHTVKPGGLFVAVDYDIAGARSDPQWPIVADAVRWVCDAFRHAGANPVIGSRLAVLLREAGVRDVAGFGVQGYLAPGDPAGNALLIGIVRSLRGPILAAGAATEEQIDAFPHDLDAATAAAPTVVLPPTVAGAWGRSGTG
jgi:SAM-dependent methyltransferase